MENMRERGNRIAARHANHAGGSGRRFRELWDGLPIRPTAPRTRVLSSPSPTANLVGRPVARAYRPRFERAYPSSCRPALLAGADEEPRHSFGDCAKRGLACVLHSYWALSKVDF